MCSGSHIELFIGRDNVTTALSERAYQSPHCWATAPVHPRKCSESWSTNSSGLFPNGVSKPLDVPIGSNTSRTIHIPSFAVYWHRHIQTSLHTDLALQNHTNESVVREVEKQSLLHSYGSIPGRGPLQAGTPPLKGTIVFVNTVYPFPLLYSDTPTRWIRGELRFRKRNCLEKFDNRSGFIHPLEQNPGKENAYHNVSCWMYIVISPEVEESLYPHCVPQPFDIPASELTDIVHNSPTPLFLRSQRECWKNEVETFASYVRI